VDFWCRYVLPRTFRRPVGLELQNLLTVARLMIGRRWPARSRGGRITGATFRRGTMRIGSDTSRAGAKSAASVEA